MKSRHKFHYYLKKFNDTIALKLIMTISTIWCVYLFLIWSLLPIFIPITRDVVFYISGGVLQLVLLPGIMVGQNILGKHTEIRAEKDHKALMEILSDIRTMVYKEKIMDEDIEKIKEILNKNTNE